MIFNGLEFSLMKKEDISVLIPVMKRAFDDDARLFFQKTAGDPPGYDDGSFLEKWGFDSNAVSYRINLGERAIGAIILFIDDKHKCGFLGNMFIDSELIGKGYGYTAWCFVEHRYPQIAVWETETPAVSYRNHHFYINKCGFHVVAVEGGIDRYKAQFKLKKEICEKMT
ncbi:GNAT family N-acetyltransferase [Lacrimispora sp.]|uniref:GNAT family N-acetyltransferase n=1 Tax=Lacrimispora sp. TaxID=2719234 RepID=UPI002FDA40BE